MMTEKELEKQLLEIINKHKTNPAGFKFKERAEKQLANLLKEDTKPEDIDAIKHIIDAYPNFDSIMINIGAGTDISINFFISCEAIEKNPDQIKNISKMIINMTK